MEKRNVIEQDITPHFTKQADMDDTEINMVKLFETDKEETTYDNKCSKLCLRKHG